MILQNNLYKVWWWATKNNYGDILTPLLFDYFKIPYEFTSSTKHANIISIGSIASKARPHTIVLGSGFISTNDKVEPRANYKFVRGPMTRKKIIDAGGSCPEIFGDPALLLPLIISESEKEHEVGIIPHYIDYHEVKKAHPNSYIVNLQTNDPVKTTKEITKCKKVISSSLHGLIVAHAYGIPAAWVKFSNNLVGDDFKFYDYAESVKIKNFELSTLQSPKFYHEEFDTKKISEIFKELC